MSLPLKGPATLKERERRERKREIVNKVAIYNVKEDSKTVH